MSDKKEEKKAEDTAEEAVDTAPAPAPEEAPASPAPEASAPAPQPAAQAGTLPDAQDQQPAAPAPQAATPTPQAATSPAVELTPQQEAKQRLQGNIDFADDLKYGKIAPKTYKELFDSKSTLGKIGTIFGLMLSGGGSALAGQPDAMMEMMNKEIERDFEAQRANQTNKQSWYTLGLQHERQRPEVAAKWAEAQKAGASADFERWKNKQAGVDDMSASADILNNMTAAALAHKQSMINNMPPGPIRDAAQARLDNEAIPFFLNKAQQRQEKAAGARAVVDATNPPPKAKGNPPPAGAAKSGVRYDVINQDKLNAMIQKGRFAPEAPDAIPPHEVSAINNEIEELTANRNNYADADAAFNILSSMKNAGEVPAAKAIAGMGAGIGGALGSAGGPMGAMAGTLVSKLVTREAGETLSHWFGRNREILANALKTRMGKHLSQEERDHALEAVLPSWTDTPESLALAHENLVKHFTGNTEETAPTLTRYGIKYDAPKYPFVAPKIPKSAADEKLTPEQAAKEKPSITKKESDERSYFRPPMGVQ